MTDPRAEVERRFWAKVDRRGWTPRAALTPADPSAEYVKHGLAGTYSAGCRCSDCRKANSDRMKRYRAGERSPWGRGRPPSSTRLALLAAKRLLAAIMDDTDGWSIFDAEMNDEGQEAANALAIALDDVFLHVLTPADPSAE